MVFYEIRKQLVCVSFIASNDGSNSGFAFTDNAAINKYMKTSNKFL